MKTSIPLVEIILLSASNCNYVSLCYLGYFLAKIGKPPGRKILISRDSQNYIYLDIRHLVEYLELSIHKKNNISKNTYKSKQKQFHLYTTFIVLYSLSQSSRQYNEAFNPDISYCIVQICVLISHKRRSQRDEEKRSIEEI